MIGTVQCRKLLSVRDIMEIRQLCFMVARISYLSLTPYCFVVLVIMGNCILVVYRVVISRDSIFHMVVFFWHIVSHCSGLRNHYFGVHVVRSSASSSSFSFYQFHSCHNSSVFIIIHFQDFLPLK